MYFFSMYIKRSIHKLKNIYYELISKFNQGKISGTLLYVTKAKN